MKNNYSLIIALAFLFMACKNEYPHLEKGVYANIETEKGNILLKLHHTETPLTVANFVSLAEGTNTKVVDSLKGVNFYDGLPFHRVIANFMIQGGDIKRSGKGDPGYKFGDEFPRDKEGYLKFKHDRKGILSMANSGPNTNGSQFFITHKETPWLDGKHTVFGEVVEGLNVVDSISQGDLIDKVVIMRVKLKSYDSNEVFEQELQNKILEEANSVEQKMKDSISFSNKMNESEAILLKSGLKYLEIKKGSGANVKEGDRIQVNYTGYFANGAVFDTSAKRNRPLEFTVGVDRVIEGWTQGVQYFNKGSKGRLFIPYDLAYGERGYGPIPALSSLIFDIEIVNIDSSVR